MPLTSIRYDDYNGKEKETSVEALLQMSLNDPGFPYPYPLLKSMLHDEYVPAVPPMASTTELLWGCLRCTTLQRFEPFSEHIKDMWARFRGTELHRLLETHTEPNSINEVRFFAPIPGTKDGVLSGKMDKVRQLPDGTWSIVDLKRTKKVPMWDKVWDDHNSQLQIYRWLVNHDLTNGGPDYDITRLFIWYVDNDGMKPLEVRKSIEVPTAKGAKYPTKKAKVPDIWTDEEVEGFIVPRYEILQEAYQRYEYEGYLPSYPAGFDYIRAWQHQYSPTAALCVKKAYESGVL